MAVATAVQVRAALTLPVPKIGDIVVTMSYPGLFNIVEIQGEDVKIADGTGHTRVVRGSNVRRVDRTTNPTSE